MPEPIGQRAAEFPCRPTSAAAARQFLRSVLTEYQVPEPPLEMTILLTNELVANGVLHARTDVGVRCILREDCVRVEVCDGDTRRPKAVTVSAHATSGRGLGLVRDLSDNWGVEGRPDGKAVWFEMPMNP